MKMPRLKPLTLPLASALEGATVRDNSLAITTFIQSSLLKLGKHGYAAYVSDQAADNNETIEVLSRAHELPKFASNPAMVETLIYCLNWAYAHQLTLLSEGKTLLADEQGLSKSAA
jgi:hypothetical protein